MLNCGIYYQQLIVYLMNSMSVQQLRWDAWTKTLKNEAFEVKILFIGTSQRKGAGIYHQQLIVYLLNNRSVQQLCWDAQARTL